MGTLAIYFSRRPQVLSDDILSSWVVEVSDWSVEVIDSKRCLFNNPRMLAKSGCLGTKAR